LDALLEPALTQHHTQLIYLAYAIETQRANKRSKGTYEQVEVTPTNAAFVCCEHGCPGDTHVMTSALGFLIELNRYHIKVEVVSNDGLLEVAVKLGGPLIFCM